MHIGFRRIVAPVFTVSVALVVLAACGSPTHTQTNAYSNSTVFINGDILTMNEAQPTAEALAIRDGVVLAVGSENDVRSAAGKSPNIRDISGQTLMPGLIDAHGHFGLGAFINTMADLQPPPAGPISNLDEMSAALKKWHADNPDSPWIFGFGYDDSLLAEGRHPTREDLDKISTDTPIMLLHVSAHFLACNTPCLEASGITADTANPPGGIIRRVPGTNEPDGVLEETAMGLAMAKMPPPSGAQAMGAVKSFQSYYASHGITTAQEGAASPETLQLLQGAAKMGLLDLDVVAYPAIRSVDDFNAEISPSLEYANGFRVGGIKLILDGSPQGKTAWLTQPYHVVPEGSEASYAGYSTMETADVNTLFEKAFAGDIQVLAHANGDAAADQLIGGVTRANDMLGDADRRTVMIHAQTVRDDQLEAMKTQGIMPSYFAAHTFFWGDWHRDSVLGPERAARISPLKTTLSMDVPFTIHNDTPVVPPDMMRLVWAAVNRETRSAETLGAEQKISAMQALEAVTINAAYQYFEDDKKGSLEAGKLADIVILSGNPTTVPPADIKNIRILETIKEGESIFAAK